MDQLWVDHLTELDDFRRGVGLRGYGGTDPLNEFKREAFQLYEELRGFIRRQVASTIFRVSVQRQDPAPPPQPITMPSPEQLAALRPAAESGNGSNGSNGTNAAAPPAGTPLTGAAAGVAGNAAALLPGLGATRTGPVTLQHGDEQVGTAGARAGEPAAAAKLGRNDPCYCGSGKKFKKCHGA
jgi:preprotein translocase subunit SecA